MSGQRPLWSYGTGAFMSNPNYPMMDARAYASGAFYGPDRMVPQSTWPSNMGAYTGMQPPLRPVEPGFPLYREYDQTYDGMILARFGRGPR
ncbi:hypothetical protein LTR56_014871 [Elasticomyces elasticus]|nr:hypothetical protein LTR22_021174 [Elasticomyces elasticus]KAK3635099.1 hypothetical protein LTR56_014871 [Elasticomyces elasticus]KAK4909323.1 hypothetical protein LTR49_021914 [Elasticomyces elasticus]KAK5749884.1 hypothetical protein LTS12_020030 [Elasticomyces elasticus]